MIEPKERSVLRSRPAMGAVLLLVVLVGTAGVAHPLGAPLAPRPPQPCAGALAQRETLRQVEAQLRSQREKITMLERETQQPAAAPALPSPPRVNPRSAQAPTTPAVPKMSPKTPPKVGTASDQPCVSEWDPLCRRLP